MLPRDEGLAGEEDSFLRGQAMLLIIGALRRELQGLEPLLQVQQRAQTGRCVVRQGLVGTLPVALVQSGIGKERAQEAAGMVMERYRPQAVLSMGYAGGVSPEVKAGDLILPERLFVLDHRTAAADGPSSHRDLPCDTSLLEAASLVLQEETLRVHRGDLLTVPSPLADPLSKKWVGTRFPVMAVDMESYWIGEMARERGVPFLAVRAASDEAGDALPDYRRFLDEMGEVEPLNAASYFLSNPHRLLAAPRLASNARLASRSLGTFAALFFTKIFGATREVRSDRRRVP